MGGSASSDTVDVRGDIKKKKDPITGSHSAKEKTKRKNQDKYFGKGSEKKKRNAATDVLTHGMSNKERNQKKRSQERKDRLKDSRNKINDFFEQNYPEYSNMKKELKAKGLKAPEAEKFAMEKIQPGLADSLKKQDADIGTLRGIGQSKGPTEMAKRQEEKQRLEEQTSRENLYRQNAQAGQQAFSDLASQGGAEAGARERLQGQIGGNSLREQQNLSRAGTTSRLGISSEDEARKMAILGQLPNLQNQYTATKQNIMESDRNAQFEADKAYENNRLTNQTNLYNLGREDVQSERDYNMQKYGVKSGLFGGQQVGKAQLDAARKGTPGPFGFDKGPFGL